MSRFTLSLLASLMLVGNAAAELKVEPNKENVVASRIAGDWQTHAVLNERLQGKAKARPVKLSFKVDPKVAEKIPPKYTGAFIQRDMKIYLAGHMTMENKTLPFVVTQVHGNPHVFFWLERDGDPFGNGESFNVMLSVAKDKQNDLLFVGGDFNNQAFIAFERIKPAPKK